MKMREIQVGVEYVITDGNTRPNKYTGTRVRVTAIGVDRQVRKRSYGPGSSQTQPGVAVTYLEDDGEETDFSGNRRQTAWSSPPIVRPQVIKQTWVLFQADLETGRKVHAARKKANKIEFGRLQFLAGLANAKLVELGASVNDEVFQVLDPKHGYGTKVTIRSGIHPLDIVEILAGVGDAE